MFRALEKSLKEGGGQKLANVSWVKVLWRWETVFRAGGRGRCPEEKLLLIFIYFQSNSVGDLFSLIKFKTCG